MLKVMSKTLNYAGLALVIAACLGMFCFGALGMYFVLLTQ